MKILVTGGAGYIGSHTCVQFLDNGYEVVVIDNFSNSSPVVLESIKEITGKKVTFYEGDVADETIVEKIFDEHKIDAVIHFAGLKAVGESVKLPLKYYKTNIDTTITLCEVMARHGVKKLVFSSSATVYGNPHTVPITEDFPVSTTNPYGTTKLMLEKILTDIASADDEWHITLLRYFNPIGAHESGLIGESPNGIPNNLLPYVARVATGELEKVNVFGDDYDTPDGTGVRDYIHVVDLANGHLKAIENGSKDNGVHIYNLGTGTGYSVLDMIKAFEKASGRNIPYQIAPRRSGDIATCYANATRAKDELKWEAQYEIGKMCEDAWKFASTHIKQKGDIA